MAKSYFFYASKKRQSTSLQEKFWPWANYSQTPRLSNQILDDESYGWYQLNRASREHKATYLSEISYEEVRDISRYLSLVDCHYIGLLRTYRKYIVGKTIKISPVEENEAQEKVWRKWTKQYKWKKWSKELIVRFFRDGEVFIYVPSWQFLDPNSIRNPGKVSFGIEVEEFGGVQAYYYLRENGQFEVMEPEQIIHVKSTCTEEKRGIPYFFAIMAKTQNYDKWLGDRLLLNRIRASIAIIRKHSKGSQVSTFADSKVTSEVSPKETTYGESLRKKIFEPGTVIDVSPSVEYQFLEPKIRANDVSEDGRRVLLAVCAATGLPEYMVTGDASNSNYASTLVAEGPAVREFEDWRDFFEDTFQEIWDKVQEQEGQGVYVESDCVVHYSSLVARKRKEEAETNHILLEDGVISVSEVRRREGVDDKKMEEEIHGTFTAF